MPREIHPWLYVKKKATGERGLKLVIRFGVGESAHAGMCLARHATTGCTTDLRC
jgi:hypothetical protein